MQANNLLTRRKLLKAGFAFAAASALPNFAHATFAKNMWQEPVRSLSFYNTHTGESLKTVYWEKGNYVLDALGEINHVLRDHRTGDVHAIDPNLLDILAKLHAKLDSRKPFEVISGYRSPRTNEMLHEHSSGVASKSQHILGKAIDIRLTDRPLTSLRDEALAMGQGGVGYYAASDFVHVDTGKVRSW